MQNIEGKRKLVKFMLCMKINFSFYILLMIILITETSCKKSHAPYFEIPPWGPVSGERGNYSFSAAAIDPDNDSIVIRFDWGDSTLSQWSNMIASGDTVTQTHFYGNTGLFQIRAQAMDINEEVSEWSDYHTFDCSTNLLWLRRYGGVSYDYGNDVKQTLDNGYIIVGSTRSSGAGGSDIYVVKTSADGTLEWEQTYGGSADDYGYAIEVASDNNYVIAGYTHSYGAGDADMYVLKIQPYGTVIWEKTYGGANTDYAYDLQETNDNGFIIIGLTASYGAGSGDLYAIRLNPNGDSIWAKTYGGLDIDCGNSVQQTVDGGYIAAGYTYSSGAGGMDIYVVKMDSNGDSTWTRTYGTAGTDYGSEVIQTVDGGYVVAGGNGNAMLLKYTMNGDLVWVNNYGEPWYNDYGRSVKLTLDNCIIFTGYTCSFTTGTFYNVYLVKTDMNGNTIWERTYGGWQNDYGYSVILTNDGNVVVTGYSAWLLNHDVLLLKAPLD